MRRIGFVSAAALAICLGAMVVAMAGGPTAPFAEWAAPRAPAATAHDGSAARAPAHGTTSPSPSSLPPPLAVRRLRARSVRQRNIPGHRL